MSQLQFDDTWKFRDGGGECISFEASDGARSFTCNVSREAIEDLHGLTPLGVNWVTLFDPVRQKAEGAIQSKFDAGVFEPDGSILLTSKDVCR